MSDDDPRGHDDGDIAAGSPGDREEALDQQFSKAFPLPSLIEIEAFCLSVAADQGFGPDDLAQAIARDRTRYQRVIEALKQAEKLLRGRRP